MAKSDFAGQVQQVQTSDELGVKTVSFLYRNYKIDLLWLYQDEVPMGFVFGVSTKLNQMFGKEGNYTGKMMSEMAGYKFSKEL